MHQQLESSDSRKADAVFSLQLNKLVYCVIHKLIKAQWKQLAAIPHMSKLKTCPKAPWSYFCHYQAFISFRHLRVPLTWLITCPALEIPTSAILSAYVLRPSVLEGPNFLLDGDRAEDSKHQAVWPADQQRLGLISSWGKQRQDRCKQNILFTCQWQFKLLNKLLFRYQRTPSQLFYLSMQGLTFS